MKKNGTPYNKISNGITKFESQMTVFEAIHFVENTGNGGGTQEFVTVQAMVDEVFAGVDFDADLRQTAQYAVNTAFSPSQIQKIYAVDCTNEKLNFYVQRYFPSIYSTTFYKVGVSVSSLEKVYFDIAKNLEGYVSSKLLAKGVTLSSSLEKGSGEYTSVLAEIQDIKLTYDTQKSSVNSISIEEVKEVWLFTPKIMSSQEMSELGITDMNAFANALLTNTKGDNYDLVTGWTMDDVLGTYVTEFSDENIRYYSGVSIYTITTKGIVDCKVMTRRYYDCPDDRYGMILGDNANVTVNLHEYKSTFSNNAILYMASGERFVPVV